VILFRGRAVEVRLAVYDFRSERSTSQLIPATVQATDQGDVLVKLKRTVPVNNRFYGHKEIESWSWAWVPQGDVVL
jgi:hypothetical protein